MSDEQLRKRLKIRRILIGSVLILLCACGLMYYTYSTTDDWQSYLDEKAQEATYATQVNMLTETNNQLLSTIEENGKKLISFSEDKIRYINLTSELSLKYSVRINKLAVSDVWNEGEMSGMTTAIEVQGSLTNVKDFLAEYCGSNYTNRVNVVSCRPLGRYAWLTRTIDGNKVIGWFDTTIDQDMYTRQLNQLEIEERNLLAAQGIEVEVERDPIPIQLVPVYDPETGVIKDLVTGVELTQEQLDEMPISVDTMFAEKPIRIYLVVDFLGRT